MRRVDLAFDGLRVCDLIVGGSVDDLDAEIDRRLEKRSDVERQVQASRSRTRAGEAASETRVVEALARAALEASRAEGEAGGLRRRRRLAGEEGVGIGEGVVVGERVVAFAAAQPAAEGGGGGS